jgi:hypothetical protein
VTAAWSLAEYIKPPPPIPVARLQALLNFDSTAIEPSDVLVKSISLATESMGTKILRLNATVSDGRIIVSFSYPPSAERYKKYLEKPESSYDDNHKWRSTISGGQVSMDLPAGVTFEFPSGSKDAVLAFADEAKATIWEEKMILWEKSANQEGTKRSISRSLTVERLNEKLGLLRNSSEFSHVSFACSNYGYQLGQIHGHMTLPAAPWTEFKGGKD